MENEVHGEEDILRNQGVPCREGTEAERREVMADLLIKGMEMPRNCIECPISRCEMWKFNKNMDSCRPNDCPIVEIRPHERCIDADALIGSAYEIQRQTHVSFPEALAQAFMDAPTVLEVNNGSTD